jgi:hypothetical protein
MREPSPPEIHDDIPVEGKCGPRRDRGVVIDAEALESLENAPEPIGTTPPEGVGPAILAYDAKDAFLKPLSGSHTTVKKPVALTVESRQGTRGIEWNGWLEFSPVVLLEVFNETDNGNIRTFFNREDVTLRVLSIRSGCCMACAGFFHITVPMKELYIARHTYHPRKSCECRVGKRLFFLSRAAPLRSFPAIVT